MKFSFIFPILNVNKVVIYNLLSHKQEEEEDNLLFKVLHTNF